MMEQTTLCYLFKNDKVLLIKKKRGIGKGKLNGPGGKIEMNETPKESAKREVEEEIGVDINSVEKAGELKFFFGEEPKFFVHVFTAGNYNGELKETEEAKPMWFEKENMPYHNMWPDDEHWMPLMFKNKKFKGKFVFDENGEELIEHELGEVGDLG